LGLGPTFPVNPEMGMRVANTSSYPPIGRDVRLSF
jgi:hypothetical protein